MSNEPVLDGIRDEVKRLLAKDSTGHDFYHAMRAAQLGRYMAHHENADPFICEVAVLVVLWKRKLVCPIGGKRP